jgi:hypothetical protein
MAGTMTNFSSGVTSFGIPIIGGGPLIPVSFGQYLFVDATNGSDSNRGTKKAPFASIDYAIGKCDSGAGDVIVAAPWHAENISAAGALACDVAGVNIIGLGSGTFRPTLTLNTAATSSITVSAANVCWNNVRFMANFADLNQVFTLTTAKGFSLDNCAFKATATNMNFLYIVDTNATTDDAANMSITNCKWFDVDTANLTFVKMDGTNSDVKFCGNLLNPGILNNKPTIMEIATGKVVTNLDCGWNKIFRLNTDTASGGILITTDGSTNSGWIYNNYIMQLDTAAEVLVTASSGFSFFENKTASVVTTSGYILPGVDS